MNQTGQFIPRSGMSRTTYLLTDFVDRYLTPISIGVAVIGLVLVTIGPVWTLFSSRLTSTGEGGGLLTPAQGRANASGGEMVSSTGDEVVTRRLAPYTTIPDRPRNQVVTYTVQAGDTLITISDAFGLDKTTVFWSNAEQLLGDVHMLRPDIDLYILPVDGVYHRSDGILSIKRIAEKYEVEPEAILDSEYNELDEYTANDIPPWGMWIVVPGGVGEFASWEPPIVQTTDETTGVTSIAFMPGMGGSCAPGIQGYGGTGAWVPPLAPGTFTFMQGFYPGHAGLDLAAPLGTPVMAADTGVVIFSGWNTNGYGYLIVLDHGNGWTTYYGHLSAINVGCGQSVSRGAVIGAVGSTGNSSGPHLHFEMRWGHTPDNPTNYIGF